MNLHEYQAKRIISSHGAPVLRGYLAHSPREAQKACINLGGGTVVVKAQVHAGGRGKAGGVKLAHDSSEAFSVAKEILGMTLISKQTGPAGKLVRKVWVEEGADIDREYYLSLVVDRASGCISIIASAEGGMEIEELAANSPEKILTLRIPPEVGLQGFHCRRLARFFGLDKNGARELSGLLRSLYQCFWELDSSLLEINPLVKTKEGKLICLDAKMAVDDNALFRQPLAFSFLDYDEIDEREIRALALGINYIALDGNIGCMVNGAGLAMATMDIIQQHGGRPANFLDVGGSATAEMVEQGFELILRDAAVKGLLVNIFGGIMHCDVVASGIIEATRKLAIEVPVVIRLRGTNSEKAKRMLAESGLRLVAADTMDEAAKKIVGLLS